MMRNGAAPEADSARNEVAAVQPAGREIPLSSSSGQGVEVVHSSGRPGLSQALSEYIASRGLSCGVSAETPQQRRDQLRSARDAGTVAKVLQGFWLTQIRREEGQKSFLEAAAELNIGRAAAYNASAAYELFNRLPDLDSIAALGQIEPTKALVLKSWTDEELVSFAQGSEVHGLTLDVAVETTAEALQKRERQWRLEHDEAVTSLQRENARLLAELDKNVNHARQMARANSALEAENELPRFARSVRHEAFALEQGAGWMLDNFEAICNDELLRDVQHPEAHRWQPVAATNAHAALNKLHGRITRLLQQIERAYPASPDEAIGIDHQLSPLELMVLNERCDRMRHDISRQAESRAAERDNTQSGRRGRKRSA